MVIYVPIKSDYVFNSFVSFSVLKRRRSSFFSELSDLVWVCCCLFFMKVVRGIAKTISKQAVFVD